MGLRLSYRILALLSMSMVSRPRVRASSGMPSSVMLLLAAVTLLGSATCTVMGNG